MAKQKTVRESQNWRVVVTYVDGETSGHKVYKDQADAEKWAERQRKSKVVKKVVLEPFVRQHYGGR